MDPDATLFIIRGLLDCTDECEDDSTVDMLSLMGEHDAWLTHGGQLNAERKRAAARVLAWCERTIKADRESGYVLELCEAWINLSEWLARGGFAPKAWAKNWA